MIGISACLGGLICRYDGQQKVVPALKKLVDEGKAIMVCPEVMGGLPTPRPPAEIVGGNGMAVWHGHAKVVTVTGEDVTKSYQEGAVKAYQKLREHKIDTVIMKAKSPSCGVHLIYDGCFTGTLEEGMGVATAYFIQQQMTVLSDEEWLEMRGESNGNRENEPNECTF